jgi:hypothetical protein
MRLAERVGLLGIARRRTILYSRLVRDETDLMVIEDFR